MAMEENNKSRVLVIGATGRLGRELITASLAASHPTFALVRETAFSDHDKSLLLRSFESQGVTLLKGSLEDISSLVEAVRQVDVVICAVPSKLVLEQRLLIRAIKEAGCIKVSELVSPQGHLDQFREDYFITYADDLVVAYRFIPSEFGVDPTKVQVLDMDNGFYEKKFEIRNFIEEEGIPYTYICCNLFMRYLLPSLIQPGLDVPPRDEIKIFGSGETKAVFVKESDAATFTICTIDDPRTLNRTLYLRPPSNVCSINELIKIWEMKIDKEFKKVYISEEQLLKSIHETPFPRNMDFVFIYSAFIKGDHTYFNIELSGFDANHLYSHVKHTTGALEMMFPVQTSPFGCIISCY